MSMQVTYPWTEVISMQAAHPAPEVMSMQAAIGENDVTILVSRPGVGRLREH